MTKDQNIQRHSLYAQWHMTSALTGHCNNRVVYKGDHQLTPDELRDDAMETAKRHIEIVGDIIDGDWENENRTV